MAITPETVNEHLNDPAILCCRKEKGSLIDESSLEDPSILPDLEESGLLTIPEECLKIGEVLHATLLQTVDALSPLTPDLVEGAVSKEDSSSEKTVVSGNHGGHEGIKKEESKKVESEKVGSEKVKIYIGEGKDINLEIPVAISGESAVASAPEQQITHPEPGEDEETAVEPKELRRITYKYFQVEDIRFGPETKLEGKTLYLREDLPQEVASRGELVYSLKVNIIAPDAYDTEINSILDLQPVATKEGEDRLGSGSTRVLDGVVVMITGVDENGFQIGEFGSSDGVLQNVVKWNRPGAPDEGDYIICVDVVLKDGMKMERPGPNEIHRLTDSITQEIREALKDADQSLVVSSEELCHKRQVDCKKVIVVKEAMGQGAMHDNLVLPDEPAGIMGGKSIIDLGNMPIALSPLEMLDGGVHALTCVGPASKENSRHYWREPLVKEILQDEELDLAGVILVGSPDDNTDKHLVAERLGMIVESMDVDGAFIQTEGFGNNHIDFALHHEEVGRRGISLVGLTYSASQGALVMGNKYMGNMIDLNKSEDGRENEILAYNTVCRNDAVRASYMLKAVMAGEKIKAPEKTFTPAVKENNLQLIEEQTGYRKGGRNG